MFVLIEKQNKSYFIINPVVPFPIENTLYHFQCM